mmetsp:Transcript_35439/g.92255  ORF Transcript_35439/g.92255 Transcript_35439/m.92255 type:complete len:315 (+) Transcript_35439:2295-3239(+)
MPTHTSSGRQGDGCRSRGSKRCLLHCLHQARCRRAHHCDGNGLEIELRHVDLKPHRCRTKLGGGEVDLNVRCRVGRYDTAGGEHFEIGVGLDHVQLVFELDRHFASERDELALSLSERGLAKVNHAGKVDRIEYGVAVQWYDEVLIFGVYAYAIIVVAVLGRGELHCEVFRHARCDQALLLVLNTKKGSSRRYNMQTLRVFTYVEHPHLLLVHVMHSKPTKVEDRRLRLEICIFAQLVVCLRFNKRVKRLLPAFVHKSGEGHTTADSSHCSTSIFHLLFPSSRPFHLLFCVIDLTRTRGLHPNEREGEGRKKRK